MLLGGDLKPGSKIIYNDEPYSVISVTFVKPGKGGAFARTKMKNIITKLIREVTFSTAQKINQPDLNYKNCQYLYTQNDKFNFMDQETFEDIEIDRAVLKDIILYMKEQEIYIVLLWEEKVIDVTPPIYMNFKVTDTQPGIRGNTVQGGATKPAKTETGLSVAVPLFVGIGEKIKIDTRTGEYVERVK
jgi:elongation factor P